MPASESGYKFTLKYKPKTTSWKKKNRRRNVIWFNPPFSKNVTTNVAKLFFRLLDKHFPKSNRLNKIFSKNAVKLNYSCVQNVTQIIKRNNKHVTRTKEISLSLFNCKNKSNCPMNRNYRVENVVYKCVVYAPKKSKEHVDIGVAECNLKQHYCNHTCYSEINKNQ